jgi:protein SCO1/2
MKTLFPEFDTMAEARIEKRAESALRGGMRMPSEPPAKAGGNQQSALKRAKGKADISFAAIHKGSGWTGQPAAAKRTSAPTLARFSGQAWLPPASAGGYWDYLMRLQRAFSALLAPGFSLCLALFLPQGSRESGPVVARRSAWHWIIPAALMLLAAAPPRAIEPQIPETRGVDIVEHPGAQLPLDAEFANESSKLVTLGQYFNHDRPVIVALVYYTCPTLCNLTLNGMTQGFRDLDLDLGKDYDVVTISINPRETADLAAAKKRTFIEELGRPGAAASWHWLVGEEAQIERVADAVGFKYRYDLVGQQYLHASAIYSVSPGGKVSRYHYGIAFDPKDLRLSLVEASEGKVGSTLDRIILYCHRYDPVTHRYTLAAMNVMRVGGVLTLILMGAMFGLLKWRERRRPAAGGPGNGTPPEPNLARH